MTVRTTRMGTYPNYYDRVVADTELELLAYTPSAEVAEGVALDAGASYVWSSLGWQQGAPYANRYCFMCIPGAETSNYWGDISGRGNHLYPDLATVAPFATAGYFSTEAGTAKGASIDTKLFSWNPARESLLLSFILKKAAPGSTETILSVGCSPTVGASPRYDGFYVSHRTSGALRAVPMLDGTAVAGTSDSTLSFSDTTPQDRLVTIAYDAKTGVWYIWRDGVLSNKWDAQKTAPGSATAYPDANIGYPLRVGGYAGTFGTTVATTGIRALQLYKFSGTLPSSLGGIIRRLVSNPAAVVPVEFFQFPPFRSRVTIVGQSNEQGPGPTSWFNRNNGWGAPLVDLVSPSGGYNSPWPLLSELVGRRGRWLDVGNTAIGTTGLADMWVGRCRLWSSGQVWQTGSFALSPANGHIYKASTGSVTISGTGQITNSSLPVTSVNDPSVGGDAGLTWTDLGVAGTRDTDGRVYASTDTGRWDPNGLVANAAAFANKASFPGYDAYGVLVSIGQGDKALGVQRSTYRDAMVNLATYFTGLGLHTFLGMTCYGNTSGLVSWIDTHLNPGRLDALALLSGNALVHAGGDVATYLGTLPTGTATNAGTVSESFPAMLADQLHINPPAKAIAVRAWDAALKAAGW